MMETDSDHGRRVLFTKYYDYYVCTSTRMQHFMDYNQDWAVSDKVHTPLHMQMTGPTHGESTNTWTVVVYIITRTARPGLLKMKQHFDAIDTLQGAADYVLDKCCISFNTYAKRTLHMHNRLYVCESAPCIGYYFDRSDVQTSTFDNLVMFHAYLLPLQRKHVSIAAVIQELRQRRTFVHALDVLVASETAIRPILRLRRVVVAISAFAGAAVNAMCPSGVKHM